MYSNLTKSAIVVAILVVALSALMADQQPSIAANHETKTAGSTVVKGLDIGKFHTMTEELRAHPEYADVEFRARVESEDVVYHSTARIGPFSIADEEYGQTRDHVLHLGVPVELQAEVVSPVDRIEPVELALAGMADCVTGTIAVYAAINGIEVDEIRTSVHAPLSLLVFAGVKDLDKRDEIYGQITIDVELEGKNLTEADRDLLATEAMRSPALNLIALAHDIEPELTIMDGVRGE
jgi:uncharacterized OsmC-like protein